MQHSLRHVDTIFHPKSSYVTTKLYGLSTRGCNNNNIFQKELFARFLQSTYAKHVGQAAAGLGDAFQSGKMATSLNSLFSVFKISLVPITIVLNSMIIIVKWCNAVTCNWCVSLDIDLI